MEISLTVTIELSDRVMAMINSFDKPSGKPETVQPAVSTGPAQPTVELFEKEETVTTGPVIATEMPEFSDTDVQRVWLIEQLGLLNVEIPPRTRTTTLEKMWHEAQAKPETADLVPATSKFDDVSYTKAQVTNVLKAYVTGAANDKERGERRDKVRNKLKECGADNVTQLEEKHYTAVVEAFKE